MHLIEVKVPVQYKAKEEALITEGEFPSLLFISIVCFRVVEMFADLIPVYVSGTKYQRGSVPSAGFAQMIAS